jgi:putative endonuclease
MKTSAGFPAYFFMEHWVYILQSRSTGRYYCGQTTDLSLRIAHNGPSNDLSKTTKRFKGPWELAWSKQLESGSEAIRLERRIKKRGIGWFLQTHKGGCKLSVDRFSTQ